VPGSQNDIVETTMQPVSDGYFETMNIPVVAGRAFSASDMAPPRSAVIVNDTFARRYFGKGPAVGGVLRGRFQEDDARTMQHEVVGVVADARYDLRAPAAPVLYVPLRTSGTLHLRISGDPSAFGVRLRQRASAVAPALRVTTITTQATVVDGTLIRERLLAALSGFFAAVGLALVGVGLYGVLSYSVLARTREIGIRMALGASARSVVAGVVKDIGAAIVAGTAAGMIGGAYMSRFVESLLFEVRASEAASTMLPLLVFLCAALIAAALPAWRATRIEPVVALRRD
jgi:ABC-type antimicrobial peptide transport system permease subunit